MQPSARGRARGRSRSSGVNVLSNPSQLATHPTADTETPSTSTAAFAPSPQQQQQLQLVPTIPVLPRTDLIYKTRPDSLLNKRGTNGKLIKLQTNYFTVPRHPKWQIFQYHVQFDPIVVIAGLRRALIAQHRNLLGGYLFDGNEIFITKKLETPNEEIVLQSENREGVKYNVKLKLVSNVSMDTEMSFQILNLILRKSMNGLQLQLVGRNFFDPTAKISIQGEFNIELWPGYVTSIRNHEQNVLICNEITHKVMRTDTVYELMQRIYREQRDFTTNFLSAIIGQTVLTAYNNKTYRIDDVDFNKTPRTTFETKNGPISFIDYYAKRYNIQIQDVNQPLLVSKAKAREVRGGQNELILLIPELCRSTGLTDAMKSNFRFMKKMDEHTRMGPTERIKKLLEFNKRLRTCQVGAKTLSDWNMEIDDKLVEVDARILPKESIMWGEGKSVDTNQEADWTNDLRSNSMFYNPVKLERWILLTTDRTKREAFDFVRLLADAARGLHFTIAPPKVEILPDDRQNTYVEKLEKCAHLNPQMIVCVVSNNNADRYGCIKKKCCVDRDIPTQVLIHRTITPKDGNVRSLMSIATKVAIQINCKLGGAPWMVKIPPSGYMAIGYDVCVDSKDKRKSYGALVASMDLKIKSNFFSTVSVHSGPDEINAQIALNTLKAVNRYRELHETFPTCIVFYRSGVGDGQVKQLIENEVKSLEAKLKDVYSKAQPGSQFKLIFIVVNTRINSRFFANQRNPMPGTVIDDVVTLPERYDFYLIPQSVRQGTVSATSFNVIYDTSNLPPERLQQFTYKLTHLYFNCSKTVRVPAVCKYASKLATLVGQFLHQTPNIKMENELYYL